MRAKKQLSQCNTFLCLTGCLALFPGLWNRIVALIALWPPNPPGYIVQKNNNQIQVFLRLWNELTSEDAASSKLGLHEIIPLPTRFSTHQGPLEIELMIIPTKNQEYIHAFYYKFLTASHTIIFSHGNSTDIGLMFYHILSLAETLGVNIVSYDYAGYGGSPGVPTKNSIHSNIWAIFGHITAPPYNVPVNRIILYGQSIGSVPTLDLASHVRGLAGVIIHSGLKGGLARYYSSPDSVPWHEPFQNIHKVRLVDCPIFFIHGTQDDVIDLAQGYDLYEAAQNGHHWWVEGAGHNDIETFYREEYMDRLKIFLNMISQRPSLRSNNALYQKA